MVDYILLGDTGQTWIIADNGTAQGYTTKGGISAAKETTKEAPLTDRAVIDQCFIVPFVPVTK